MAKILVVDDDPDFQDMMSMVLESAGHTVTSAFNGAQAMARIAADRPDVILLDVIMTTETEGIEVAGKLKGDPATAGIPIIMLSSVNIEKKLPVILEPNKDMLPVDKFLDKPVKPAVLLSSVAEVLGE